MRKIIFLDIDGVLINRDCYGPDHPRPARAHVECVRQPRPVESFVILDDDADMCHLMPRLVRSETAVGLTAAEADRAITMLNSTSVQPQT